MRAIRVRILSAIVLSMLALGGPSGRAEDQAHPHHAHAFVTPDDLQWQDGPPSLPAGAQFAIIEGDPTKDGLFTMRVQLPANYRIPAHWHPADEHVTVISGTFHMGAGDMLDVAKGQTLPAGSFALMPAQMHHFAWTTEPAVIQLHGVGPWQINYLNPTDDPRTPQ